MPAKVCIKHNLEHPKEFLCLDQGDWQYGAFMNPHMYSDPIQEAFRKVISRTLIQTFNLFKYHLDAPSERYLPRLPTPVNSCVDEIIAILKAKIEKFIECVEDEAKDLKANPANAQTVWEINSTLANFNSTCAVLNVGTLACLILDTTHAFRANKNWNSHGSMAASAVLHLGSVLASLQNENRHSLDLAHMEMIPKGEMQTGAKHGNHHVSYVEYMCGNYTKSCDFGLAHLYLNHPDFRKKKRSEEHTSELQSL